MPAKSEAQRAYLYSHFGKEWVEAHHFNTPGKLPARVGMKTKKAAKPKKKTMKGNKKGC